MRRDGQIVEIWMSVLPFANVFLPEVREFITRHTAYNKHDTGWAKGAPSVIISPRVSLSIYLSVQLLAAIAEFRPEMARPND